jgi:hypothetical protein
MTLPARQEVFNVADPCLAAVPAEGFWATRPSGVPLMQLSAMSFHVQFVRTGLIPS